MDIEVIKCSVCPHKNKETDRAKALKAKITKKIGLYNMQASIAVKNEKLKGRMEGLEEALHIMEEVENDFMDANDNR